MSSAQSYSREEPPTRTSRTLPSRWKRQLVNVVVPYGPIFSVVQNILSFRVVQEYLPHYFTIHCIAGKYNLWTRVVVHTKNAFSRICLINSLWLVWEEWERLWKVNKKLTRRSSGMKVSMACKGPWITVDLFPSNKPPRIYDAKQC